MTYDKDILAFIHERPDLFIQEFTCPGDKTFKAFSTSDRFIGCWIKEKFSYGTLRLFENIFGAFIDTKAHLCKPFVYYHGDIPSLKQELGGLSGSYQRRTKADIKINVLIELPCFFSHIAAHVI
jgi:hypothetical protein